MRVGSTPDVAPSVLIVDDDLSTASWLKAVLRYAGYGATAVHGAAEALAYLDRERPALVLTDLEMPGTSGWTLISEIRRRHPALRIAVITAETAAPSGLAALRKPARIDELLRFVAACVRPLDP